MAECDPQSCQDPVRKAGASPRKRPSSREPCGNSTAGVCPESKCRIEAIVPIDARGQMVIPKALREKAGIRAGDNLVLVAWEHDGKVCCLTIVRSDVITNTVRDFVTP